MTEGMQAVEPDACPECAYVAYLGYEVQGVYDGVLYWVCPACGHAWPRWVGDSSQRMAQLSQQYADEHNEKQKERT
jgi:hypothetical protein